MNSSQSPSLQQMENVVPTYFVEQLKIKLVDELLQITF